MFKKSAIVLLSVFLTSACTDQSPPKYTGLDRDLLFAESEALVNDTIVYHQVRLFIINPSFI